VKRLVLWAASAMVSSSTLVAMVSGSSSAAAGVSPANGVLIRSSPAPHVRLRTIRGITNTSSDNWSGYAQVSSTEGTFTQVTDTFVVPTVDTDVRGTQFVADWVGIGGYDDPTLVQTGIQAKVKTQGHRSTVIYDAWTEHLPQVEKPLALTISAGNTVTATVEETSHNVWSMEVTDHTTGQSAGVSVPYDSSGLSAEAISERPCLWNPCAPLDLAHLAQTSNITFDPGFVSVTPAGNPPVEQPLLSPAITSSPTTTIMVSDIAMTNNSGSKYIATPSSPDPSDEGFTVTDGAKVPPAPTV
jgi:plastocyanin